MHEVQAKLYSVFTVAFLYGTLQLNVHVCTACYANAKVKFQDTLLLAHVFFRHGDRSPLYDFPNNEINITEKWPRGFGQITQAGKMQAFQLGQFLRNRYFSLVGDRYHPDDIYMLTSDYDRTIVTALLVLSGLYPAKERWHSSIDWDPVPLRTIPHEIDNIIAFTAKCPKYEHQLDCYRYHGTGRMLDANYTKFYAYLSNHTGIPLHELNFEKVNDVFDTLYVQDVHKLGVPKWAKQHAYEGQEHYLMRKISEYTFSSLTYNEIAMNLRGGPVMREIMRNFEAHTQQQHSSHNRISKFKLRLYSGHDSTIATILQVFGVYNHQLVPYTGTVLIELYKRSYKTDEPSCPQIPDPFSDMYFIKFFYKNCTTQNLLYEIPLPDCRDITESSDINFRPSCSIKKLRQVMRSVLQGDWYQQCKYKSNCCGSCASFKKSGSDFSKFEYESSVSATMQWLRACL